MLNRDQILALIPHQGAMCLLDTAEGWSGTGIICHARSHLDAGNPLRRAGRLSTVCGCEYGFQAAALHGALIGGGVPQRAGFLVGLRVSLMARPFLDDPALGVLRVEASMEATAEAGLIYGFRLVSEGDETLLEGRGTIKLPVK